MFVLLLANPNQKINTRKQQKIPITFTKPEPKRRTLEPRDSQNLNKVSQRQRPRLRSAAIGAETNRSRGGDPAQAHRDITDPPRAHRRGRFNEPAAAGPPNPEPRSGRAAARFPYIFVATPIPPRYIYLVSWFSADAGPRARFDKADLPFAPRRATILGDAAWGWVPAGESGGCVGYGGGAAVFRENGGCGETVDRLMVIEGVRVGSEEGAF